MKKYTLLGLGVLIFLAVPLLTLGAPDVSSDDKMEIKESIESIEKAVNFGNASTIIDLLSPNVSLELKNEIVDKVAGMPTNFQQDISSYETMSPNSIKVKGRFIASGAGWSVSGMSNQFVFEKVNGEWLLLETNFHTKFGARYIINLISKILVILVPIALLLGIFWLWMLIDVIRRPIENKTRWILLVIVLQALGAVLYFFVARRRHKRLQLR